MKRKGCKPLGSALVEHLDGSLQAKERLEVILETIAGRLTIDQACQRLGVQEARFHRLRTEVLEASLARLEPRSAGRPPRQATRRRDPLRRTRTPSRGAGVRVENRRRAGGDRPGAAALGCERIRR